MKTTETKLSDRPNQLRRKLFKGAYGGVGVLLAVQAKTALGGTGVCPSPSAMLSGNVSPRPNTGITCSGGRSPGFWKVPKKFSYWAGATPPKFGSELVMCDSNFSDLQASDITDHGTTLSSIFDGAPALSLWVALAEQNQNLFAGNDQLLRHLSAAWLNAHAFNDSTQQYPLTTDHIKEMWRETKDGGTYCPGDWQCGTKGWNAAAVIGYISGMYHINDEVEPMPCKKQT